MKKTFLFVLILIFVCVLTLASCESDGTPTQDTTLGTSADTTVVCQHIFGEWETVKEASCVADGERVRSCRNCPESEKQLVSKNDNHTVVTDKAVAATCKDTGLAEGSHCSLCNKVLVEQTVLPITDKHNVVIDKAVAATCKDTGLTEGSRCLYCKKVLVEQEVVPTTDEHIAVTDKAVEETCKNTGLTEGSHCSRCSKVLVEQTVIPAKEHTVVTQEAVDATCDNTGLTEGSYCDVCETVLEKQTVTDRLKHDFDENDICKMCFAPKASEGLSFIPIGDDYYWVSGIGTCKDTQIIIPTKHEGKPVIGIQGNAFKNCKNIVSIKMFDTVTIVGDSAFEGCTSLETVELSTSIYTLSAYLFKDCENLTEVDVSFIKDFKNACFAGSYIENVIIPDRAELGTGIFRDSHVKSVSIGAGITKIPANTFWGCKSLKNVVFSEGVQQIYHSAFRESGIETITFPSSLKAINECAFQDCESLTTVDFSSASVSLYLSSFTGCDALTVYQNWTEVVNKTVLDYAKCEGVLTFDGMTVGNGWLLSCDNGVSGKITVPEGVVHVNEYAFSGCALVTEIVLPSRLKTVGVGAFQNCTALESIVFPEGTVAIGNAALEGCRSLTYVSFPDTLTAFSAMAIPTTSPITISFGSAVTSVSSTFITSYLYGFHEVEFRGTKDEWLAFYPTLDTSLFNHCTIKCADGDIIQEVYVRSEYGTDIIWVLTSDGVLTISGSGEVAYFNLAGTFYSSCVKKLVIGEGITKLNTSIYDASSFESCNNLAEIEFPSTLVTVNKDMFRGSIWHKNFNAGTEPLYLGDLLAMVPSSLSGSFTVKEGTKALADRAFYNCEGLTEIILPHSVTTIGKYAFYGCRNLQSLTLHEGIQTIGIDAISQCHSLTELTIPSTVRELNGVITGCSSLKKVVLADSDSLTLNGGIASYCSALETVVIGTGVKAFPINTLYDCASLQYVIVRGEVTAIDYSAFWNTPKARKFLCYDENTAALLQAKYPELVYIYSENEPSAEGNFWGYTENGEITLYQ